LPPGIILLLLFAAIDLGTNANIIRHGKNRGQVSSPANASQPSGANATNGLNGWAFDGRPTLRFVACDDSSSCSTQNVRPRRTLDASTRRNFRDPPLERRFPQSTTP